MRAVVSNWNVALVIGVLAMTGRADPEPDYSAELPRIAPRTPAQAMESFSLVEGFGVELVAAEPHVADPVAMAFDEDGRLYVVEMRDYSEHPEGRLGRVRVLEDTNGDGTVDQSRVFAEGLSWPTAILCWDGGVFVGAAPDIIYLKDTDGDGKADLRKVVFTGFGRSNVQGLLNTFLWGLDNRIYGATSVSGGKVRRGDDPSAPVVNLAGRDFAFDPRTLELEAITGGAQHGATFDDWGHRFVCSNSDHLQLVMYEDRYAARGGVAAGPRPRLSIAADGPMAEVYRISPVEPWRIVRTRLRVTGQVPGVVEGGGRAAGYFTSATGVTVYRGDAWPAMYRGQVFVSDVGSNLIHRKLLEPDGVRMIGRRIDDGREFLASTDTWFRPVQMANGPDGNLWVLDMYREVIEHPASIPPIIKKHLDLDSGRDRGRIYRIVHAKGRGRDNPRLKELTGKQLVKLLEHPNGWHRQTAARLLYERQDAEALQALRELASGSAQPLGRLHALYALDGMESLQDELILAAMDDVDAHVRQHAVELSEDRVSVSPTLRQRLYSMADDPAVSVRYRAAFVLGAIRPADGQLDGSLARILKRDGSDPWVRFAAISSAGERAASVLGELLKDESWAIGAEAGEVIGELAAGVPVAELGTVIEAIVERSWDVQAAAIAGLGRRRNLREELAVAHARGTELLEGTVRAAGTIAVEPGEPTGRRTRAVAVLALGSFEQSGPVLSGLLHPRHSLAVQQAAVRAMQSMDDPDVGPVLLAGSAQAEPALRMAIVEAMLSKPARTRLLLDAIESGRISASLIGPEQAARLAAHPDASIRQRAARQSTVNQDRRQVIERYKNEMAGLRGDARRGQEVFAAACATCHRIGSVGFELGPNLAAFVQRGPEAMLVNVLDPNAEVNPQFVSYIATTTDGRVLSGIVTSQTAGGLTLAAGAGITESIGREQIATLTATGLSLMPVGLEATISPQAMADLLAYLNSVQP